MDTLYLKLLFIFLRIAIHFVPHEKYVKKLHTMELQERTFREDSFHGWEYNKVKSPVIPITHHYFEYPSANTSGPLFLMLHGLALDGRTFAHMSELSRFGRLVAYNLPERTELYKGNADDYIKILGDFLEMQDISNGVVFCGVSAGGGLAAHLAASHAIPVPKSLILISTQLNGKDVLKDRKKFADWIRDKQDYQILWLMEKIMNNFEKQLSPAERDSLEEILYIKHPDYYRQVVYAQSNHNGLAEASKITCPTLILYGEKDKVITADAAAKMKKAFKNAEIQKIPKASHVMTVTQGKEIAQRIAEFLQSNIT